MRNETYKVQMTCCNCGLFSMYDIPVRREIVAFERYYIMQAMSSDEPDIHVTKSCTQRANGTDKQPLICNRCKLPYLQPAFYAQPIAQPAGDAE